jgi:hypothetical protein
MKGMTMAHIIITSTIAVILGACLDEEAAPADTSRDPAGTEALEAVALAADEWTPVATFGGLSSCRTVENSSVPGGSAFFHICWNSDLTDVRLSAEVEDTDHNDGYHAEARIRYKIKTGSSWSGWHYRAAATSHGFEPGQTLSRANQVTANVQVAACVYNVDTLINCDDRGWQ